MTDIELPEDTRKSRLPKPNAQVMDEEFVTAAERFAAFRKQHPDGYVEATIDRVIEHPDGNVTYVMNAAAYVTRPAFGVVSRPDATAWAQGSTNSDNQIIASSPLESADTIARSRALRNLGILDGPAGADQKRTLQMGKVQTEEEIGAAVKATRGKLTLSELAELLSANGVDTNKSTLSRIENGIRPLTFREAQHLAEIIGFPM